MDDCLPFGLLLKRFRLAAGLTHEALAERASLGARTISDLERGVSRSPRADTLNLLLEALDLDPEQRSLLMVAARPKLVTLTTSATASSDRRLPQPLTSFVGREREVAAIRELLCRDDIRLVTLTGPGGVGKTRLALHVVNRMSETFPDGVLAVDLAPTSDRDGVCDAIDRAFAEGDGSCPPPVSAIESFGRKKHLLLLDNFEHLLEAAPVVTDLIRGRPGLTVLTTSRAPLRVSGEQEFPVAPLPVPDPAHLPGIDVLASYAAITLFVDRAIGVKPDFGLSPDNASSIAAICALLDGLPLAVELAATRVRTLPPRVLRERLQQTSTLPALGLLSGGPRDAPERLQTLRDTIAWSHALLTPEEQCLFRRLAVFAGGCSLDAAEAVCAAVTDPAGADSAGGGGSRSSESDVLEPLHSLVEKSLVSQDAGPNGEPRFRLLETIRAYASEVLAASGEEDTLRRRHAQYYLEIVEAMGALLFATPGTQARLAAEHGNVQVALQWLVQHG